MSKRLMSMRFGLAMLAIGALASSPSLAAPERSPEEVIRDASTLTMDALEGRRDELADDRDALFEIVDKVLLPRWDRRATGQAVMGRYWRDATEAQRDAFIDGLYRKLLDSYAEGILEYEPGQFKIIGTRGDPAEGRVTVDSEVMLDDGTTVPISYRMRLHEGSWKVFDVIVEGISYLTNYRSQYASEFRSKGVQGVIDELQEPAEGSSGDSGS